jgi:hypothetical protein
LQPEQEAQQSSEAQQPGGVALAVPARPSAMTAINSITLNIFMIFSFVFKVQIERVVVDGWNDPIRRKHLCVLAGCFELLLNAEKACLQKEVSAGVYEGRAACCGAREKFERGTELQQREDQNGGEVAEMRDGVLLLQQRGVEGAAGNRLSGLLVFL